jgi:hypothetical protein
MSEIPVGWIRFVDSWGGYSVAHPPGWEVFSERGILSVRGDPSGRVEAQIWPGRLKSPLQAREIGSWYAARVKADDPTFEAWVSPELAPQPDRILLLTRRRRGQELLGGMVSITVFGGAFLLSGFHAPERKGGPESSSPSPDVSHLIAVLSSFQGVPPLPRGRFQEPREGSFEALVPLGWYVDGRLQRDPWTGAATFHFSVRQDPAGVTSAFIPTQVWPFAEGLMAGFPGMGMMETRKFMPATQFARDLLPSKVPALPDQKVERIEDASWLLPEIYTDVAQVGMTPENAEVTAAYRMSTYSAGSVRLRQKTYLTTLRPRGMTALTGLLPGQWIAALSSVYQAPEAQFASLDPVLFGVVHSFRTNPVWRRNEDARNAQAQMAFNMMYQNQLRIQKEMMDRQRNIHHTLQQASNSIMESWAYRQKVLDHTHHQWSNAILGRTDVVDPAFGTVYSVPNDYPQYWRDNSGYFYGGGWLARPDPRWQKLEPITL